MSQTIAMSIPLLILDVFLLQIQIPVPSAPSIKQEPYILYVPLQPLHHGVFVMFINAATFQQIDPRYRIGDKWFPVRRNSIGRIFNSDVTHIDKDIK